VIRLLNAYFPSRTVFLGASEACLILLSFVGAAVAQLGRTNAAVMLSYEQGYLKIAVICASIITCMYYFDLYDSAILRNAREVFIRLVQVLGAVCFLLAFLYYAYPRLELRREIFAAGFLLVTVILFLWRRLFLTINGHLRFAERVLLFGEGPLVAPLLSELESRPELGLRVVGHVSTTSTAGLGGDAYAELSPDSLAATSEDLSFAVEQHRVNRVIVAMGDRRGRLPVGPLLTLKSRGVRIQDGSDLYEAITGKVPIESLRLGWLLFSPGFRISRFLNSYKRFASLLISTIGLFLTLPLLPLIALAIKLTSSGPVFYKQRRMGCNGVVFECYKFRTMREDAEADTGPIWADDSDPRITPVGRFLRISRLDEIPQLWNVMKGDMSLVGPRPERPEFVEWLNQEIPYYYLRHTVRPGITGWAQVRYEYGSSLEAAREKLRYDLFYIKNISPGLDLLIFCETIKTILLGRGR
jgi:sugar transferase (PEP-CTERM system associated)